MVLLFLSASLCICIYALVVLVTAWKSSDWAVASGQVLSSRIISSGKSGKPEVEYTYTVNGETYEGNHILIGPGPMGGGFGIASPREYVYKYPEGKQIKVFYDPEDPRQSVLEPGVNRVIGLMLLMGVFFLLLGTLMLGQMNRGDPEGAGPSNAPGAGTLAGQNDPVGYSQMGGIARSDQARRRLSFLTALAFLGVIGYAFWPEYHPWLVERGILKSSQPYQEAPVRRTAPASPVVEKPYGKEPPTHKRALDREKERAGKRARQDARKRAERKTRIRAEREASTGSGKQARRKIERAGAEHIVVSISKEFAPVRTGTIGSRWKALSAPFSDIRPGGIVREPAYQGSRQLYGNMTLGTQENNIYYFIFDLADSPHPVLYLDRNQNGDLADDGEPLRNQGSGRFASEINLPVSQLIKEIDTEDDFVIWFFLNEYSWKRGYANHYSRTQMKGTVSINSKKYVAYIAEWKLNDADFTNDGIYIDLDSNGTIEQNTEYIGQGRVIRIEGRDYLFDIRW